MTFGPTLDQLWMTFGPTLDQLWMTFGPTLDQLWMTFGPTLNQFWMTFGPTLDQLWMTFGPTLGQLWNTPARNQSGLNTQVRQGVPHCPAPLANRVRTLIGKAYLGKKNGSMTDCQIPEPDPWIPGPGPVPKFLFVFSLK